MRKKGRCDSDSILSIWAFSTNHRFAWVYTLIQFSNKCCEGTFFYNFEWHWSCGKNTLTFLGKLYEHSRILNFLPLEKHVKYKTKKTNFSLFWRQKRTQKKNSGFAFFYWCYLLWICLLQNIDHQRSFFFLILKLIFSLKIRLTAFFYSFLKSWFVEKKVLRLKFTNKVFKKKKLLLEPFIKMFSRTF